MASSSSQSQTHTRPLAGPALFSTTSKTAADIGETAQVNNVLPPHLAITISQSPILRISKDLSVPLDAEIIRAQKRSTSLRHLEQANNSIQTPRNRSSTILQTPTPTVARARAVSTTMHMQTTTYLSPQDAYRLIPSRSYDRDRRDRRDDYGRDDYGRSGNARRQDNSRGRQGGGGGGVKGGVKKLMTKGVLYLTIVNLPSEKELQAAREQLKQAKSGR